MALWDFLQQRSIDKLERHATQLALELAETNRLLRSVQEQVLQLQQRVHALEQGSQK